MTILLRLLPYILGLAAVVGGWIYVDRACWSTACKAQRGAVIEMQGRLAEAQARATAIALKWAEAVEKTDAAVRHERLARIEQGRDLSARAANLDRAPTLRISGDALRVFESASNLANSAPAPIRDKAPAVAVPESTYVSEAAIAAAWAEAAIAYLDAKSLHLACVNFYEGLRNESH